MWVTRAGFVWGIRLLTFAFCMHNDFCDRDVVIVSRVHLTLPDVAEAPPATMRRPIVPLFHDNNPGLGAPRIILPKKICIYFFWSPE